MTRDQLRVGKKYYNQIGIVEVLYIGNQRVFYRYDVDNAEGSAYIKEFLENCEPVKEKKTFYFVSTVSSIGNSARWASFLYTSKDECIKQAYECNKSMPDVQLHSIEIEVEE